MAKRYRREALGAIHETLEALHGAGMVDKRTMREFDEACLTPIVPIAPEEIRAIRTRENLSQPVFARYLNVSKNLVSDWEREERFLPYWDVPRGRHNLGSGRTDAGVHALGQVANFISDKELRPYRVQRALNALTPEDVTIKTVEIVPDRSMPLVTGAVGLNEKREIKLPESFTVPLEIRLACSRPFKHSHDA